jgi:hypothetical protein
MYKMTLGVYLFGIEGAAVDDFEAAKKVVAGLMSVDFDGLVIQDLRGTSGCANHCLIEIDMSY